MLGTNSVIPTVGLALGLPRPDKSGLAMTPFVFVITRHASAEAISGRGNEIATPRLVGARNDKEEWVSLRGTGFLAHASEQALQSRHN